MTFEVSDPCTCTACRSFVGSNDSCESCREEQRANAASIDRREALRRASATKTVTVVAAFRDAFQASLRGGVGDHFAEVQSAAVWAGEQLSLAEGLGFTAVPSWCGGAGWDTEAGVTFTFAGLSPVSVLSVLRFARALKAREAQQAVAVLVRDETFALV